MKTICHDRCNICGRYTNFVIDDRATLLREACCSECHTSLRVSDLVGILQQQISLYQEKNHRPPRLLNLCSIGRVHELYSHMQGYTCGEYFDGIASGEYKDGILCIDLQNMPLADASFDIIVTEDVLEHVASIGMALREINRVLKTGGLHIFTVPVHENIVTMSRKHKPVVYHGDPLRPDGVPVVTDFGRDLADFVDKFGMHTDLHHCHRFHAAEETSFIDDEYEAYRQKSQYLMEVFRYNSIVVVSSKIKNLSGTIISMPFRTAHQEDEQEINGSLLYKYRPKAFLHAITDNKDTPIKPVYTEPLCNGGGYRVRFALKDLCTKEQHFRFAPLKDDCCEIEFTAVRTDMEDYSMEPVNAFCRKGCRYLFVTTEPAIDIIGEADFATFLELEYRLRTVPAAEISALAIDRFMTDQEKMATLSKECDALRHELKLITSARGYRLLEKLRQVRNKFHLS